MRIPVFSVLKLVASRENSLLFIVVVYCGTVQPFNRNVPGHWVKVLIKLLGTNVLILFF